MIFLSVAAYVGYKRAPLPIKAPIDMALRCECHNGTYMVLLTNKPIAIIYPFYMHLLHSSSILLRMFCLFSG